jgi:hypothetical protein
VYSIDLLSSGATVQKLIQARFRYTGENHVPYGSAAADVSPEFVYSMAKARIEWEKEDFRHR